MKAAAKSLARICALLAISPALVAYQMGSLLLGPVKAFSGWSQTMSLLPGVTGVYLRRAFYRLVLPRCDDGVWVGFGTVISHPTAELGRNVTPAATAVSAM